jgi:TusA-related sulfurtransferase
MATLDTTRLKSPNDILKIVAKTSKMKSGSILEVRGKGPTFENDVRAWCEETGRGFLSVDREGQDTKIIRIRC